MKTLKEEVMELLMKRIGVAEGEEFEAKSTFWGYLKYKFLNGNMLRLDDDEKWTENYWWDVFVKYFYEYKFKLKAFNPNNGGRYWYVNMSGELQETTFNDSLMTDVLNRSIGNCFRTKVAAQIHKEEILKMLGVKMVQENSLGEKR